MLIANSNGYLLHDVEVDGVSMAQFCTSIKFGYHKIWGSDTGRNNGGDNSGTLLGIYPKITFTFGTLDYNQIGILLGLFNKAENKVSFYNPDLKRVLTNVSCYSNDQEFDQNILNKGKNYSSALISNRKRDYYV